MFLLEWFFFVAMHLARMVTDILTIIFSPLVLLYYNKLQNNLYSKKKFRTILITGGSSGIGRALAMEFASPNNNIIITGTNNSRLKEAENAIKQKGCKNLIVKNIDVCNAAEMKNFIIEMDKNKEIGPIDLVIANAGKSNMTLKEIHYQVAAKELIDVNIIGVLNTILPSIQLFQDRKKGHIAIVGSILSFLSASCSGSYSATKAYLKWLCDDLRPKLKLWNIDTTLIAPGFVNSQMNPKDTHGGNFGFMMEDKAASIIKQGLENNKHSIEFPQYVFSLAWIVSTIHPILQRILYDKISNPEQARRQIGRAFMEDGGEFGGEC